MLGCVGGVLAVDGSRSTSRRAVHAVHAVHAVLVTHLRPIKCAREATNSK